MGSTLSFGRRLLESDSISDVDRLTTVDEEHNRLRLHSDTNTVASTAAKRNALRRTHLNMAKYDEDKVFARSPKAEELKEAVEKAEPNTSTETLPGPDRQRSIITLSSQSNPASPTPPVDNKHIHQHSNTRHTNSFEEMEVITSNTRSIAALAAQRRSKAHLNAANNNERLEGGHYRNNSDENKLTVSRLAYHDHKYGTSQLLRNGLEDSVSIYTDQDGLSTHRTNQHRIKYRKSVAGKKLPPMQFGSNNNRQRSRSYEPHKQERTSKPQRLSESQPPSLNRPKQRHPWPSKWNKPSKFTAIEVQYENDLKEFETTPTPPVTVRQKGADRGTGLTIQKKVRGPKTSDGSSTVHKQGASKKSKRLPPTTIPNYKNGDMSITGHGFAGGGR